MRTVSLILGVIIALLGALWLLQGLGALRIRPILCFADCAPVEGPSLTWAVTGLVALGVGMVAIAYSRKRGAPR